MTTDNIESELLEIIGTHPAYINSEQVARVLALGDSATIDRLKKIKSVKADPKIYTKILAEITAMQERIKQAGLSKKICAINQKKWHHPETECGTPHCAGGWVVAVTPGGHELEKLFGMPAAPMIILRQSHPDWPLPNFDGSVPNEAALAFITARAAEEAKA